MFFWRLKNCMKTGCACVFALLVFCVFYSLSVGKLSNIEGERTFFLDSPSSQALRKQEIDFWESFRVKGECVRVKRTEECTTEAAVLEKILTDYKAEVRFVEKSAEIVSYYCYTEKWSNGILIGGEKINLHVAIGNAYTVVGTPIIFDGY